MKSKTTLIALFLVIVSNAQIVDYNIQNGFVAEGYDVVAYFDNQAQEGSTEFQTTHDGVSFKFSSQHNLNTFKSNPKKYIPQYGGYCAYAIGTDAKKVSINPKSFELRDGKLYLFYDTFWADTLKKWKEEDPDKLKDRADKNWEHIKFASE